ncbi:MAG: hypothetical protein IMF11_01650 [Proteobacteria bacterium]|nr:hypothetical protein [Pseudomonadota bacterium]
MEPREIAKQMIDFQKTTFDNTYNAMILLQDQAEAMVNTFLGQSISLPEEGEKLFNVWGKAYKKGRVDYMKAVDKAVDESFKRVEDFFDTSN